MTEKFKIESASGGETWGETRKRIVLQETETAGVSGLAVSDVLKILKQYMVGHEKESGGDPDKLDNDVVDNDDVGEVLLELEEKEGLVEIKEGRIYLVNKK